MTNNIQIKIALLQNGLTQSDLANLCGVSKWHLNRVIKGNQPLSKKLKANIEKYLSIKLED